MFEATAHAEAQNEVSVILDKKVSVKSNEIVVPVTILLKSLPLLTMMLPVSFFRFLLSGNWNTIIPPAGISVVVPKLKYTQSCFI